MEEKIKIIDESGDRKYWTQIPNYIANHSTANDQALYFQMKRYAGENGKCFATQQTLLRKMGIGIKAYNKALKYLLDKKWVKFVGLTGCKTRPIKTYAIVDIWKLNIMEYEKITPESTISFQEIPLQSKGDTSQKNNKIPPRSTIEEEPTEEEPVIRTNVAKTSVFADNINPLIKLFEAVNPTYERLFSNKTQRAALERLVKKFGEEKIKSTIEALPEIINKPYAPKITTPLELERDLGKLIAFFEQEKGRKHNLGVIKT